MFLGLILQFIKKKMLKTMFLLLRIILYSVFLNIILRQIHYKMKIMHGSMGDSSSSADAQLINMK